MLATGVRQVSVLTHLDEPGRVIVYYCGRQSKATLRSQWMDQEGTRAKKIYDAVQTLLVRFPKDYEMFPLASGLGWLFRAKQREVRE
jgi:predicted Rdx family selenoprotein